MSKSSTTDQAYTPAFYGRMEEMALQSSTIIVDIIMQMFHPAAVADVGCGTGGWLRTFAQRGVKRIQGYEAGWLDPEQVIIPREQFAAIDLSQTMPSIPPCDLVLSLEVAEHLPARMAEPLVACLCQAAPVVLFSAAVPGQGGTQHINEQPHLYWRKLFARRAYACIDAIRPRIWADRRVDWPYRQNIFLFLPEEVLACYPDLGRFRLSADNKNLTVLRESILEGQATLDAHPLPDLCRALLTKVRRRMLRGKARRE